MNMQDERAIQIQQVTTFILQKKHALNHRQNLCQPAKTSEDKTQVRN